MIYSLTRRDVFKLLLYINLLMPDVFTVFLNKDDDDDDDDKHSRTFHMGDDGGGGGGGG